MKNASGCFRVSGNIISLDFRVSHYCNVIHWDWSIIVPKRCCVVFSWIIAIILAPIGASNLVRRESVAFHLLALSILFFAATPAPVFGADILKGHGVSKTGEHIHLGPIEIPWSTANEHFGYIYKRPGLSFANVSSGPWIWRPTDYLSYEGFSSVEEIGPLSTISFSTPEIVVFAASPSPLYQSFNRGLLLVRYYHTYGAIYFDQISGDAISYQYWYNPSGECAFTPKSVASEPYSPIMLEFNSDQEWDELTVVGGGTFIFDQSVKIKGLLKVTEGTVVLKGGYAEFKHITIQEEGKLIVPSGATIRISGNLNNKGEFITEEGTLVFNGTGPQFISGDLQVQTLEIDTPYFVMASAITVEDALYVFKGALIPSTKSSFHHVFIGDEGMFLPFYYAKIDISGHLYNDGTFIHNQGTIILSGETTQCVVMNGSAFYNLQIMSPELIIDEILVDGKLVTAPDTEIITGDYPLL